MSELLFAIISYSGLRMKKICILFEYLFYLNFNSVIQIRGNPTILN